MNSWNGIAVLLGDTFIVWLLLPVQLFTLLIPPTVWLDIFGGVQWNNILEIVFIPFGIGRFFNLPLERGFLMA